MRTAGIPYRQERSSQPDGPEKQQTPHRVPGTEGQRGEQTPCPLSPRTVTGLENGPFQGIVNVLEFSAATLLQEGRRSQAIRQTSRQWVSAMMPVCGKCASPDSRA